MIYAKYLKLLCSGIFLEIFKNLLTRQDLLSIIVS